MNDEFKKLCVHSLIYWVSLKKIKQQQQLQLQLSIWKKILDDDEVEVEDEDDRHSEKKWERWSKLIDWTYILIKKTTHHHS